MITNTNYIFFWIGCMDEKGVTIGIGINIVTIFVDVVMVVIWYQECKKRLYESPLGPDWKGQKGKIVVI